MRAAPADIFVGREREMAELIAALEDVVAGRGRIVMLAGEPGIGKTRTAEELVKTAHDLGVEVFWGRCPEERGIPSFWPWRQVLRSYIAERDDGTLRADLGPGDRDLVALVPEIGERLGIAAPQSGLANLDSARFRLFDSITAMLKRGAAKRPLGIVLDDLHWSDTSSLRLLEFIASEVAQSPVFILGTCRNVGMPREHPLYDSLGQLSRVRGFSRIELRGIPASATTTLIESTVGSALSPILAAQVHTQTDGNPFFVTELARVLRSDGLSPAEEDTARRGGQIRLPDGVRDAIRRRLNTLSTDCNEVLTVAAILGREFSLPQISAVLPDHDRINLLEDLDEAIQARLVEKLPARQTYQFIHALIQRTLETELPNSVVVQLHAKIAEALERFYGTDADEHAEELVHHLVEAKEITDGGKITHYSTAAARKALAIYAFEDAITHFEQALMVHGEREDETTADILEGLAYSHTGLGGIHVETAQPYFERAFHLCLKLEQNARAIDLATVSGSLYAVSGQLEFISAALELVVPNSREHGLLLSRYGPLLYSQAGAYGTARELIESAVAIGRNLDDAEVQAWGIGRLASVEISQHNFTSALKLAGTAFSLAQQAGVLAAEVNASQRAAEAAMILGRTENAHEWMSACRRAAERSNENSWRRWAYQASERLSLLMGNWDEAISWNRRLADLPGGEGLFADHVRSAYVLFNIGDEKSARNVLSDALEPVLSNPPESARSRWPLGCELAVISSFTRDDHLASIARPYVEDHYRRGEWTGWRGHASVTLGLVAVTLKDRSLAEQLYPPPAAIRRLVQVDGGPFTPFSVDRVLGMLAVLVGDTSAAARHFDDASIFCREAGYLPELALTCHDYAEMLLAVESSRSVEKARALVDEGEQLAGALPMAPWVPRFAALRETLATRRSGRTEFPDGLTGREVEVLRLLAAGNSNRDIADTLFISQNTVIRHVSNIFSKTGVSSRAEATGYAHRAGLVE